MSHYAQESLLLNSEQTHWLFMENKDLQAVLSYDRQKLGEVLGHLTLIINSGKSHQHRTYFRQPPWVQVTGKGCAAFPVSREGAHRQGQSYSSLHAVCTVFFLAYTQTWQERPAPFWQYLCSLCLHLPYPLFSFHLLSFRQETALIITRCHG